IDHQLGRDVGSRARAVLDDERLAQPLRQPLPHQARNDVVAAGRREAADQTHRPARIGVRERTASNGGRGDSARRQLEKLPAEKVHDNAPGQCKRIDSRATPRSQNQRRGAMIVLDACDLYWWLPIVWFSAFTATRGGDNQAGPRAAPSTVGFRTTARLA